MFNLRRLSKDKIIWLDSHRCKCGHTFLEHPNCLDKEKINLNELKEKIGIIDIETDDLNADYGIIFSYYIKTLGKNEYLTDHITEADFKKYSYKGNGVAKEDTRVVKQLMEDMKKYDRLVGHYSSGFDIPFIRTRATICGLKFYDYGEIFTSDTWRILKDKFKLSRNSLENGTQKLLGKTRKNHLSSNMKHAIIRGEKWAMDYCLDHNKKDVDDTDDLFKVIRNSKRETKTSI